MVPKDWVGQVTEAWCPGCMDGIHWPWGFWATMFMLQGPVVLAIVSIPKIQGFIWAEWQNLKRSIRDRRARLGD